MTGHAKHPMPGERSGKLVAVSAIGVRRTPGKKGTLFWLYRCDCGREKAIGVCYVRNGHAKSCGHCGRTRRHSHTAGDGVSPEYAAWNDARARCRSPKHPQYANYGGRGIVVCELWQDFANFLADMGERPGPGYSLDRIDPNGNYEPGNCRWIPTRLQAGNQRRSWWALLDGAWVPITRAAARLGVDYASLRANPDKHGVTLKRRAELPDEVVEAYHD